MIKRLNKKGNVLDIGLPILTLFMCAIVIYLYFASVDSLNAALVSPSPVLEITDEAILFEREEYRLLKDLYCEENDFNNLKAGYCSEFNSLEGSSFLTGAFVVSGTSGINSGNFCDTVYSFEANGDEVSVKRTGLVRKDLLNAQNLKLNFNMQMEYYLDKQYLLTKEAC